MKVGSGRTAPEAAVMLQLIGFECRLQIRRNRNRAVPKRFLDTGPLINVVHEEDVPFWPGQDRRIGRSMR